MTEKQVEQYLGKKVRSLGGISLKLTTLIGIPDKLVLLPQGICIFVELKRPGEQPRKIQLKRMEQLSRLGFKTFVADDYKSVEEVLRQVMKCGV